MGAAKCPGQDCRYWKPDDVFQAKCNHCGRLIEFFKDDLRRKCPYCKKLTVNPKNDLGCAKWCKSGGECLAQLGMRSPPENAADTGRGPKEK